MSQAFIHRPLTDFIDEKQPNPRPQNRVLGESQFDQMLRKHCEQARSGTDTPNQNPLWTTADDEPWAGLDSLRDLDVEYYKKGVKRKTLAATFSANHSSKLEERLSKYKHLIEAKAEKYKLDPVLLAGLVRQESNFNPYAVSHCGAMGLGQLMPQTARYLGVVDPFNASQNLEGAAKYLREQLDTFGGNVSKALAAYNAGPGAVKRYGGIPPYRETQNYVRSIRSHCRKIQEMDVFVLNETNESKSPSVGPA